MAFRLARCTRIMMLMVPVWPVVSQLTGASRHLPAAVRCAAAWGWEILRLWKRSRRWRRLVGGRS